MAKDTITLALNGDIPFRLFAEAMLHLNDLVSSLSDELGVGDNIDWSVDDLQHGSAIVTMRGVAPVIDDVERVVFAYSQVGASLERGERPPFSDRTIKEAHAITSMLDGRITSVLFETPDSDAEVASPIIILEKSAEMPRKAIGIVKGRIDTIGRHAGLRFTLYDTVYNRAVSCYLEEGKEEIMREMWGKAVVVEGEIRRDSRGRPVAIRHIRDIHETPESRPGSYLAARGVAPRKPGAPRAEEAIRRLRDA
jgi:hypothetical protein